MPPRAAPKKPGESDEDYARRMEINRRSREAKARKRGAPAPPPPAPAPRPQPVPQPAPAPNRPADLPAGFDWIQEGGVWNIRGETKRKTGESTADYVKRIRVNRASREAKARKRGAPAPAPQPNREEEERRRREEEARRRQEEEERKQREAAAKIKELMKKLKVQKAIQNWITKWKGARNPGTGENREDLGRFLENYATGDPAQIFYSANPITSDMVMIHLLEKYKQDCYIIGKRGYHDYQIGVSFGEWGTKAIHRPELSEDFEDAFKECIEDGAKLILIPMSFNPKAGSGHKNAILYRVALNQAERFEPHGARTGAGNFSVPKLHKYIEELFTKTLKDVIPVKGDRAKGIPAFTFQTPDTIFPATIAGWQHYEGRLGGAPSYGHGKTSNTPKYDGFCQMWSMLYLELCMKFPEKTSNQIALEVNDYVKNATEKRWLAYMGGYIKSFEPILNRLVKGGFSWRDYDTKQNAYRDWVNDTLKEIIEDRKSVRSQKRLQPTKTRAQLKVEVKTARQARTAAEAAYKKAFAGPVDWSVKPSPSMKSIKVSGTYTPDKDFLEAVEFFSRCIQLRGSAPNWTRGVVIKKTHFFDSDAKGMTFADGVLNPTKNRPYHAFLDKLREGPFQYGKRILQLTEEEYAPSTYEAMIQENGGEFMVDTSEYINAVEAMKRCLSIIASLLNAPSYVSASAMNENAAHYVSKFLSGEMNLGPLTDEYIKALRGGVQLQLSLQGHSTYLLSRVAFTGSGKARTICACSGGSKCGGIKLRYTKDEC